MSEVLEAPPRPVFANYVGGEWRSSLSGRTYEKRNPARPSEAIGEFPASDEADVEAAVGPPPWPFPRGRARPLRSAARS